MTVQKPDQPLSLVGELRRRRVLYTAVAYGISAFAVTEIAAFLFENFGAPDWAERLLAALFVAGFPVAMFLSWAFDIGTDGIVRASHVDRHNPRKTLAVALVLLLAATGGLFYLIFPEPQPVSVAGLPVGGPDAVNGFEPFEKLENSIAVLPFENLSPDPDDAFFSSGVAEEVMNHLGAYRELNIIGRTSSFSFSGSEYSVPRISALLGVRFLLQGSVRRNRDQIRVSTRLLDENGLQLWSRNFDRRLTDIFAIQSEIAGAVAEAVFPEITAAVSEIHPTDPEAYDHFLRGRELVYKRRVVEAEEALQRAIELDPQFAPAWAELAIALMIGTIPERVARAGEAVETALSLQPDLLRGQAAQGLFLQNLDPPDWPASEAVLRRVLARDPSMGDALNWLSITLRVQGRDDEADEVLFRAVRLDPLHPALTSNAMMHAMNMGEDQRAIDIASRLIENPQNRVSSPYVDLFNLYSGRGRLVDTVRVARQRTEDAARSDQLDSYCYCLLTWAYAILGDWDLVNYWRERSDRDFPDSNFPKLFNMLALRWQGRIQDALKVAERNATDERYLQQFVGQAEHPGILQALAGDYASAIESLTPLVDVGVIDGLLLTEYFKADAIQALAWAYLNSGQSDRAEPLLSRLEEVYAWSKEEGTLQNQSKHVRHGYALNAALMGENEEALDRLEEIIETNWRKIHLYEQDPRWDPLRDHPRFQALVALVKADVSRQRAELEAMEPNEVFVTRLDAIRSGAEHTSE